MSSKESKKDITKVGDGIYYSSEIDDQITAVRNTKPPSVEDIANALSVPSKQSSKKTKSQSQPDNDSQQTDTSSESIPDTPITKTKKRISAIATKIKQTVQGVSQGIHKTQKIAKQTKKSVQALFSKGYSKRNKATYMEVGVGKPLANKLRNSDSSLRSSNTLTFQPNPNQTMGLTNINDAISSLNSLTAQTEGLDINPSVSLSQVILSGEGLKSSESQDSETYSQQNPNQVVPDSMGANPEPQTYVSPNPNMVQAVESVGNNGYQGFDFFPQNNPSTMVSLNNDTALEDRFIEWYQKKEMKKQKLAFIKHEVIGLKKHQFFDTPDSKNKRKRTLLETDYFKSIKKRRIL